MINALLKLSKNYQNKNCNFKKNEAMKTTLSLISIIVFSISVTSCGEDKQVENVTPVEVTDTLHQIKDSIVIEEDDETTYRLPSALQIAYVSKKSGAPFNESILNKTENLTRYNTSNYKRAVNFGIYSSDLANCLFNKKYQESKRYLKALTETGATLGLKQAFESDKLAERFDKNISNEDTLVQIVSNVQLKTDNLFEQNKQKHITVIAFAGAWIESIYIANQAYTEQKNKKILSSICEQLTFSKTLIKALEASKLKEQEIPELLNSITEINDAFYNIPPIKSATEKNKELNFDKMKFADTDMVPAMELVKTLRTKMIN